MPRTKKEVAIEEPKPPSVDKTVLRLLVEQVVYLKRELGRGTYQESEDADVVRLKELVNG
jgi:hypothetical protein